MDWRIHCVDRPRPISFACCFGCQKRTGGQASQLLGAGYSRPPGSAPALREPTFDESCKPLADGPGCEQM